MSLMAPFARFWAVLRKEFIQMRRDRLTFAMMVALPIIQLLLFGYAINNDPRGLETAVVAGENSVLSRSLLAAMENTGYFAITGVVGPAEADAMLARGEVSFVVNIPADFASCSAANAPWSCWRPTPRTPPRRPTPLRRRPAWPPRPSPANWTAFWRGAAAGARRSNYASIAATTRRALPSTTSCPASSASCSP